jgi:predicted CXXCH cytochrome family protein
MRTGQKTKNQGMIRKILRCRLLNENFALRKRIIASAFRTILIVLTICFLIPLNFSEAQVPDEHKTCTLCHIEDGSSDLKKGINETCIGCHPESPGRDHPIGIVINNVSEKLPLDRENKITCITCHEPHGKETKERLLRIDFNNLCIECHKM